MEVTKFEQLTEINCRKIIVKKFSFNPVEDSLIIGTIFNNYRSNETESYSLHCREEVLQEVLHYQQLSRTVFRPSCCAYV